MYDKKVAQRLLDQARAIAQRAQRAGRDLTSDESKEIDGLLAKVRAMKSGEKSLRQQIDELNTAFMGKTGLDFGAQDNGGPWADAFVKGLERGGQKALMSPSGAVSVPGMIDSLTPVSDKVETILQLIPWRPLTATDAFSYLQETVRQHNAAPVATGEKKPTSVYTVERVDDRVRTIAHLTEAIPRSYLADIGLLRDYIRMVLREGYELELEYQIIQGDGTGENFTGMLNTAGIQVVTYAVDVLSTCRRAITALEVQPIRPGAFVIHPEDWETFELQTEDTGGYLMSDGTRVVPVDRAKRQLWGYPVALSLGIPEGTGILADWAGSTKAWEREEVRVDWSEAFHVPATVYDADATSGFERNEIKFRAEGRAGFGVLRPAGIVEIELEAGS